MDVLATYEVGRGRRIELCQGDLAMVGPEDASDLLVISAFPDNYFPTTSSLVGQLSHRGLSVAALAADKEADLRITTSCWISKPIEGGRSRYGFDRLLCYEPRTPARAAETVGDLFRALVPYVGPTTGVGTVAMSVVGSGDMARPFDQMLAAILEGAGNWMSAGLALDRLRIELNMARLKHLESPEPVLFPLYALSCEQLPLHLRVLNYVECREADPALISAACRQLVQAF